MTDSPLTKEKADRIKALKAEVAQLEAETSKPRESKEERQRREAAELIGAHSNGELAMCKELGKLGKLELTTKAAIATASKLNADGLVMLFGDEGGTLFAKPSTHWYGIAMADLK